MNIPEVVNKPIKRRDFMKLGAAGVATVFLSTHLPFMGTKNAFAATQTLDVTITDALKDMVTHNSINTAQCYFWIYQMKANGVAVPPDCPGPTIMAIKGDTITINITNALDENHSFFIPGNLPTDPPIFDSGPILPGATVSKVFTASQSGAFLYYDNLNDPVNRVMGLHGAMVVRPAVAAAGHKFTPYDNPTPHVQNIYDAFGTTDYFPGLSWEDGDPATNTPPFRTYVWLDHQASPNLFAEVGNFTPGQDYPAAQFLQKFLHDPFTGNTLLNPNNVPQYFTINGQSGFFSHFSPAITPMNRVGEPIVIHIINAGLWEHSMHIHCNHVYVTSINGAPNPNPIWIDVYTIRPMDRIDYTVPYMRPPDNANVRGIGRPDAPLKTISGHPVWPPVDEFQVFIPPVGTLAALGSPIDLAQRMSPLCFPMHDHSEASQTAQGGNYNCGLISGMYVVGDRNAQSQGLGNFMDFPMDADFAGMYRNIRGVSGSNPNPVTDPPITGLAAGPRPNG